MQAMVVSPASKNSKTWFFDTGATHHLAQDIETLSDVQAYKENEQVIVGNVFYTPTMSNITSSIWHSRLGHPIDDILIKTLDSCNITYQRNKRDVCSACPVAKSHKLPFSLSNSRVSHPLALIHTDL
ncbi:hypothetical protein CK203_059455 [Vitis vinifera]|uniref:GAG-pre-integrase domain-containing protein n=1 Tax=Vitis vinifera TaxID=29760 RepID=A0A438GBW0_VITVI|nr:hypothetical protein CK203_059455 [Vitis vinifera]